MSVGTTPAVASVHHGLRAEVTISLLPAPDREIALFGRIPAGADRAETVRTLKRAATEVRRRAIQTVDAVGAGHLGGEFSITDALVTLYLRSMNISPEQVEARDPDRDRVILSKGHAANALYTTLAMAGYLHPEALRTFLQPQSLLNGHPAITKIKAVEASTGPLGHGLPIGVGTAVAAKLRGSAARTFVLLGDGEMQEGSNWEALMTAAHRGLDNLVILIDRNRLQQGARTEDTAGLDPFTDKLTAFGWHVIEIDGHDHGQLLDAFDPSATVARKPTAIVANTLKGYPVSYMTDNVAWHHKVPTAEQVQIALDELDAILAEIEETK